MNHIVEAICTGTARPFNGVETSAIAKYPREGMVQILEDGFAPDEQADRRVHGGPEMAVHLYPLDHHAFWRERLGNIELLDQPGAFGSNLAVRGISERDVYIGDRFRLGSALLEVSQPRQPCWKIEHRFGSMTEATGMVATIIKTGRSGWYFRVLEIGETEAGDSLELVERAHEDWSVARTFAALFGKDATYEELEDLQSLHRLAPKARAKAAARLG
ncbi:MOSC domain-containing protein [Erythrobacter sp. GH1-10]|uniref:MOSC domain-containing protein n=1 Tax=Erythrobacter sp. GH1-10 TaxID=3349334 RepID=UPI003877CF56